MKHASAVNFEDDFDADELQDELLKDMETLLMGQGLSQEDQEGKISKE